MTKHQDAVIILAAGEGTRMLPYSPIPKHMLPYQGKPVITRIVEQYSSSSLFVVVLNPKDTLTQDYLSLAHPNLAFEFVTSKNDEYRGYPLHDLLHGLEVFHSKKGKMGLRRVFLTVADGVYELPFFTYQTNWIAVAPVNLSSQPDYTNVTSDSIGRILKLKEKAHLENSQAWIGVAHFQVGNVLHRFLEGLLVEKPKASFSDLFAGLNVNNRVFALTTKSWVDLGTAERYTETLPALDWSKPHEFTYVLDTKVLKVFKDSATAKAWAFRGEVMPLKGRRPKVAVSGCVAQYEKILGSSGYDSLTPAEFGPFLGLMKENWPLPVGLNVSTEDFIEMACWPVNKAEERLSTYLDQSDHLIVDSVNGLPVSHPTGKFWNWARTLVGANFRAGTLHGDLTLDNLVVDQDDKVWMIDWRPQQHEGTRWSPTVGDINYDFAKLMLSIMVDLKALRAGRFHLKTSGAHVTLAVAPALFATQFSKELEDCAQSMMLKTNVIRLHVVLQLLSMTGLHKPPFNHIFYALALAMKAQVWPATPAGESLDC